MRYEVTLRLEPKEWARLSLSETAEIVETKEIERNNYDFMIRIRQLGNEMINSVYGQDLYMETWEWKYGTKLLKIFYELEVFYLHEKWGQSNENG